MEFLEPTTTTGQLLHSILANLRTRQSPEEVALNQLNRILFMYASKVNNQDSFISALYGQKVLQKRPSVFMKKFSCKLFALQHAIGMCLKTGKHLKELIVALEWSENYQVLAEILKRVELQSEIKNSSSENSLPPEHESELFNVIGDIKVEVSEEPEYPVEKAIMEAVSEDLMYQVPAEAPQEIPEDEDDDEAPTPEAPTEPFKFKCEFAFCHLAFLTKRPRQKHYKSSHDGQCLRCKETEGRVPVNSGRRCCSFPIIIGGPFRCPGHCKRLFPTKSQRNKHFKERMARPCRKCGRSFVKLHKHSC